MLVYMLLNTVTERAYIGATNKTLEERWKRHVKDARSGSNDRLHRAIREWDNDDVWLRVVLVNCYTVEETSASEQAWMKACGTLDGGVGYNDSSTPYAVTVTNGRLGGDPLKKTPTKKPKKQSAFSMLSEEERREFFRSCGKKGSGASKKKEDMSEEERERFRAWGRKGAERSKLKRSEKA